MLGCLTYPRHGSLVYMLTTADVNAFASAPNRITCFGFDDMHD